MTEKRFYYNTFYYPNTDEVMEYEIIDRESFPNYPNHNESTDLCGWYIYIPENDSNWQDMCIDKLNELHEENQQCENEIARLQLINSKLKDKSCFKKEIERLRLQNKDLLESNVKLREENKELKITTGEMEDYLARMEEENKELRIDKNYWKTLAQSLAKTNGTLKLKDEHIGWKRVDV